MRKIIEVRIKDKPVCEFESAEDLARYVDALPEKTEATVTWCEAIKRPFEALGHSAVCTCGRVVLDSVHRLTGLHKFDGTPCQAMAGFSSGCASCGVNP